jgi:peptidoglycan hydrolase-like protein with peptidoglycan-binding domain
MVASCGVVSTPIAVAKKVNLGDRALMPGASGSDVRALQVALRSAGISVKVDGQFGPSTVRAVKRFQRAAQLTPSGVVGRKTFAALEQIQAGAGSSGGYDLARATKKPGSLGSRVPVRRGMRGQDVRVLQDFLRKAGQAISIDGRFGSSTLKAVMAFEQAATLPVDGVMAAADIDALRALAAGGVVQAQPVAAPAPAGEKATIGPDGLAIAPAGAPEQVKQIIAAGNEIATKPYKYGGGHGKWDDTGYDCSGSVSYALHGAGLLEAPLPSGGFTDWAEAGPGQWVTVYAKASHMYMVVAGLRFDTSGRTKNNTRWQTQLRPTDGYAVRHPAGL